MEMTDILSAPITATGDGQSAAPERVTINTVLRDGTEAVKELIAEQTAPPEDAFSDRVTISNVLQDVTSAIQDLTAEQAVATQADNAQEASGTDATNAVKGRLLDISV